MEQSNEEIWKDIVGFEGKYQVSSKARVKSLTRAIWNGYKDIIVKGRILKQCLDSTGYYMVGLWIDGKFNGKKVHRLVAEAFLEKREKEQVVNHIDGNYVNNSLSNLEWVSQRENTTHFFNKKKGTTSKYAGVSFCKRDNKWTAHAYKDGKQKNLGRFKTEELAFEAYNSFLVSHGIINKYSGSNLYPSYRPR